MEYVTELETCSKCKNINYCVLHPDANVFLCQKCFCWSLGYADHKDKVNEMYKELGMEDIEVVSV